MNKIVLFLIIIIASLFVGAVAGIAYQKQKNPVSTDQIVQNVQKLSSKVVTAVVTYGQVTSINSDRSITLSYQDETMTIPLIESVKVYRYDNSSKKQGQFSDIKIGDNVNITASVDLNGQLQGNMVVIFSSTSE